ncbi:MAG: 16S rRNA (adenine(1518)-N(6)/adenine(1519)-N(6))-dimethyltransferase RsmA [Alphaproteobacteria bacterium]|nr:16S rRNA (adenine(1518)-N(6)/adenine(1519)-N(6))-dimethyltransferase RsmA [Alphaproteobacteria bacterium]
MSSYRGHNKFLCPQGDNGDTKSYCVPIDGLPPLREVIATNDLRAEKKLGQNFLLDLNITDKIARACGDLSGLHVVEIGPGPGGLTRSLLKAGAERLTAVEYDPRAIMALQPLVAVSGGRLEVVHADALTVDLRTLAGAPRAVAANLPYNIATPLLTGWLAHLREDPGAYAFLTLMFQKEVAQRLAASPGSKTYGRLSVLTQWLCHAERMFDLPPQAFSPPPKVTSSVVRLTPRALEGPQPCFRAVERLTAAAFGQRRKMVRSSLKAYADHFEGVGIAPDARAEELPVSAFVALALAAG